MADRLARKRALITGAAAGIGAATAMQFAREGAEVILVDRDARANELLRQHLQDSGYRAHALTADLTSEEEVEQLFRDIVAKFDTLGILVNCAGGSASDDTVVHELDLAVLERTLHLDLHSMVLCSRGAIPLLQKNGGGSVINMTSYAAHHGPVRIHAYVAAKGAITALTRSMAGSYAKDLIRVNAVAPAAALTERAKRRLAEPNASSSLTFDWSDYPFAMGPPEDIAHIITFLASEESRMLTGQIIMADGGISAY